MVSPMPEPSKNSADNQNQREYAKPRRHSPYTVTPKRIQPAWRIWPEHTETESYELAPRRRWLA